MLIPAVLQGFPEVISTLLVILLLLGCRMPASKFLFLAIFITVVITILRQLPLAFGFHVTLGIIVVGLVISIITKESPAKSFLATAASYAILFAYEIIFHFLMAQALDLNEVHNKFVWILMGWPQILAMFLTAYLLWRKKYL